ncbi:MAG: phosphatase PAP2 family protein [Archangium sp.]|nr:phosphatase PAP2 family protein [Archangium sp.]
MEKLRRVLAWDEALLVAVSRLQRPVVTRALRGVTHLGDAQSLTFMGLVLLLVGTAYTRHLGWMLMLGSGLAALLAQVVKRLSKRRRPNAGILGFTALVQNPDAFSFPSGHTAASVALAVAWAGEGSGLGLLASAFAALVGFSRVYLGVHYPLDVMAGATLGLVAGGVARLV